MYYEQTKEVIQSERPRCDGSHGNVASLYIQCCGRWRLVLHVRTLQFLPMFLSRQNLRSRLQWSILLLLLQLCDRRVLRHPRLQQNMFDWLRDRIIITLRSLEQCQVTTKEHVCRGCLASCTPWLVRSIWLVAYEHAETRFICGCYCSFRA